MLSNTAALSTMVEGRRPLISIYFVVQFALTALLVCTPTSAFGLTTGDSNQQVAKWSQAIDEARTRLREPVGQDLKQESAKLEKVRAKLAAQRDLAFAASRAEPFEATVAKGKLSLLGPVPADGESDFAAERRKELEADLYRLQATQRAYEDSYLRSVATIALIDSRISHFSYSRLTTRAASPLWPGAWLAFASESAAKIRELFTQAPAEKLESFEQYDALMQVLCVIFLLLGVLTVTLLRRAIGRRLGAKVQTAENDRRFLLLLIGKDFAGAAIAIAGLLLMALGTVLLIGVFPAFGKVPVAILAIGAPIIFAHWLGLTLFAPRYDRLRFVELSDKGAARAVWWMLGLGLAMGFEQLIEIIETNSPYSASASGVGAFAILAILATALYFLAQTIERYRKHAGASSAADPVPSEAEDDFIHRQIDWAGLLTIAMKLSAATALILALIGYAALARWAILPLIASLVVIATFAVIYSRLHMLAGVLLFPKATSGNRGMLAFQFILLVILAAIVIPLVALLWGVRAAELSDLITLLRDGITVGGVTISLGTVVIFLGVFVLGYVLTRWVQRLLLTTFLARTDVDEGTNSAIVTGVGYIGVILAFVAAVGAAGIDLSNLAIVFGALSVGIGFGMQSVVSNFVSGIIMLIERPIKEGDSIVVGEHSGIVSKISVRATRIQSFNHDDVIIPNSELIAGTVRNRTLSDRMTRIECEVGIAYDSDLNAAFDTLLDVAKSHPRAIQDPPPSVVMEQLGDSALLLRLYCYIDEVSQAIATRSEMNVRIVEQFRASGIAIPFPQREIAIRNADDPSQSARAPAP